MTATGKGGSRNATENAPDLLTTDEYRKIILATACDSYESGNDDPTTVTRNLATNWAAEFAGDTLSIPLDVAYDTQELATNPQSGDTQKEGVAIVCYIATQA